MFANLFLYHYTPPTAWDVVNIDAVELNQFSLLTRLRRTFIGVVTEWEKREKKNEDHCMYCVAQVLEELLRLFMGFARSHLETSVWKDEN